MKESEIKALIQLLDDPDHAVFESVSQKLKEHGKSLIPYLEASLGLTDNDVMNNRLRDLIEELEDQSFYSGFEKWALGHENQPLIYGLYYINTLFYPDTNFEEFKSNFEKLRQKVWLELNDNLTGFEAIKVLNHLFYFQESMSVDTSKSADFSVHFPESLFLGRQAGPFAFVGVYSVLAQSLNLPVFPVYLPGLLVLAYENEEVARVAYGSASNDVLFYINPYDKGAFLGRKALDYVVEKKEIPVKSEQYRSISNFDFIHLYLEYLKQYMSENHGSVKKLDRMIEIMNQNKDLD